MDYLPEWKIYLYKKLLLDESSSERVFQPSDFLYFDEKAQVHAMQKQYQRSIDRLHWVENTAYSAALNGNKVRIDSSSSTPTAHQYYFFEPQAIMLELIDLAEGKHPCLEIEDIKVGKDVIQKYRQERRRILALHERRRLASITMSHSASNTKPDDRYTDPFCGLPESVYKKVENGEFLTLSELRQLLHKGIDESIYPSVRFKMRIHKKRLQARLNTYLDDFISGKLIPSKGVRYFRFEEQKKNILLGVQSLVAEYGNNTPITFEEVAKRGVWENEDEDRYRFYETLFALEKLEEIRITNLRGDEVIISVVEAKKENATSVVETHVFDAEKEKAKISAILFAEDFKIAKEKWFNMKGIIEAIYRKLPPVEDTSGLVTQPISLTDEDLSHEQEKILAHVLRHAYNNGVAAFTSSASSVVISSEPARRFLSGEEIFIKNLDKFDAYRAKINDLCDFLQKEESRFPQDDKSLGRRARQISEADKKRLYILEKLKEAWDLAPKKNSGQQMRQEALMVYEQRAGEVKIHENRFHRWFAECGIDGYELAGILTTFQQEGLVTKFNFVDESR
jgi:hypothetical protein